MKVLSANLENDREFIIKEYSIHWSEVFWEIQSKAMRAYAQCGQYPTIDTIVEGRIHLQI